MLGRESQAYFFLLNLQGIALRLPNYIRLGKFNSKARLEWERLFLESEQPEESEQVLDFMLNAADLPSRFVTKMRAFSIFNISPAPLLMLRASKTMRKGIGLWSHTDLLVPSLL